MKAPSWRYDKRKTAERGYGSRWQRARLMFLHKHPLCVMCQKQGRYELATVVDHIKPHNGDEILFWDHANWQSLCKPHHDSDKKLIEGGRERVTFDAEGRVKW
ncbi:MAG: HNH endonuclease [Variovorax sp.]|nr:MAG: HNH endonuclease [Variovorax sp.]